jgi:hypothetical protein
MNFSAPLKGCLCALALSLSASAQVLMLDFGPTTVSGGSLTSSPYHSVPGSSAGSTWNKIELSDPTTGSLFWSHDVLASNVSVALGASDTNGSTIIDLASNPTRSLSLGNPINTGIYAPTSVATDAIFSGTSKTDHLAAGVQVGGLTQGTYDIYITARNTNTSAIQSQRLYAGAATASATFDFSSYTANTLNFVGSQANAWGENINYVKLTVFVAENQVLNIASLGLTTEGDEARGFLNSIQIVNTSAVPEPATTALLAGLLAVAGAAWFRRRP